MTKHNYNFWLAITYEVINDLAQHFKSLRNNKLIKLILDYCRHDWVLWRVETTLKDVDKQAKQIKKTWAEADPPKYSVIEHEPDGSKAQELLGGAMEIRSNFRRD